MRLTQQNYYSPNANWEYMSASQIKSFRKCPAATMAELRGEWSRPQTMALLVGSYVDTMLTESKRKQEAFFIEHPEMFKKSGELLKIFDVANRMVEKAKGDPMFFEYVSHGLHQAILTGILCGVPFKAKMDTYLPGERIVDLKTTASIMEPVYVKGKGKLTFAEAFDYPMQMALYQLLEGNALPTYLAVISKEEEPDIAVIRITQDELDFEIEQLMSEIPYYDAIKQGLIEPPHCGHCAYCRSVKKVDHPITLEELREFI